MKTLLDYAIAAEMASTAALINNITDDALRTKILTESGDNLRALMNGQAITGFGEHVEGEELKLEKGNVYHDITANAIHKELHALNVEHH